MSLWMLWKGILLGLGAAAPIGPVNVEIARRSLRGGFSAGLRLGCGAVTVDAIYVIFAAFSVRLFLDHPLTQFAVGLAGAGLLGYIGINCLLGAKRLLHTNVSAAPPVEIPKRNYITGLLMTATNPMTLAFWFVAIPAIGPISSQPRHDLPLVCAGVCIGALSWVCFFATLMSVAGRLAKKTTMVLADFVGGIMLLAFAAYALYVIFLNSPVWRLARGHL